MGGGLYKHENITNSASNSVEVGAGAELGKNVRKLSADKVGSCHGLHRGQKCTVKPG